MTNSDYYADYYNNYQLDVNYFDLSERDMSLLDACVWMVDNWSSVRYAAINCGVAKSTLHRFIHTRLRSLSFELYQCAKKVLTFNQSHRR